MKHFRKYTNTMLACAAGLFILYLFYRSVFVLAAAPLLFFFFRNFFRREETKKYKDTLNLQFKDALVALAAALRAGYSLENAVTESFGEMKLMYGENAPICTEFHRMITKMSLNIPVETLFHELAERSAVEDIVVFAEVLGIAKRTGGDLVSVISKTASDIAVKIDTRNEIAVVIASKRFEQHIMNVVPMGIIVYISLTSGDLLDRLYGNALGITVMTLCLAFYCFAFFLSRRIMDIRI